MKKRTSLAGREPNYVLYWPYLVAIEPYYNADNDTWSRVYYADGNFEEYPFRCEWILEDLAVVSRTSVDVVRGRALALYNDGVSDEEDYQELRKMPLIMIKGFSFLPVKCRSEAVRNSGTLGYVVYQYVDVVKTLPGSKCQITFKGGSQLVIQQQKRGVKQQIKFARMLQKQMDAEEQHWRYEICIARKVMQKQIARKTAGKILEMRGAHINETI